MLLAVKAMVEKGQRRLAGLKTLPLPLMMADLQILYWPSDPILQMPMRLLV